MKRRFIVSISALALSAILLSSGSSSDTVAYADDLSDSTMTSSLVLLNDRIDTNEYSVSDPNGDTLVFNNEEDYNFYLQYEDPNRKQNRDYSTGTSWKTTITHSEKKNMLWVGYHSGTTSWSLSSSYSITASSSFSVSGSYKYSGTTINIGFSSTNGITTTIPADSKRMSRLGVWGDFTFRTIKTEEFKNGKATGNVQYRKDHIRHDKYIKPAYQ
ncbi:MAG: hypothetical protein GX180_12955 [Enterococcus sp.]|nr:hypothetical protein [Enterococcus sp.]